MEVERGLFMEKSQAIIESLKPFIQAVWQKTGFKELTPIQREAIPVIKDGKDLIAESPTGSGKTLAYLLPIIEQIRTESNQIQALILSPTRELAMQILEEVKKWTEGSGIRSASFIGGADIKRQMEKLKSHPQIVVGTPGRILELANAKKMKLHEVKTIVIDEADQLLQIDFADAVKNIVKRTLKERQLLFFSATMPKQVESIGDELMNEPALIKIEANKGIQAKVEHSYIVCEKREKIDILRRIANLKELKKAMVFINESNKFEEIAAKLRYKGLKLEVLHGETRKTERERIIKQFREDRFPLLLTTDLASRGLDFAEVTHIIHFDLPEEYEKYLHRSGRTGRMGAAGNVISIITNREIGRLTAFSKKAGVPFQQKHLYKGKLIVK
jgi:superfamily II DNA/RNA helicase